eukprot:CAMPEP_0119326752 /NCGR_PEP_ID=MMETSP1333-20130426/69170_1 /TAXON_ID=418940 /ORGANISM="Scyphosphaera apsteinii, Strain RCC1455" /LENGTH=165 /DNA_ID=CAMNT_0007335145 /DNA_START=346 /DNA_END=840 /DNA_ORIENTATION=+
MLRVECSKLQRFQFKCEARAEFLQPSRYFGAFLWLLKHITVVTEEDEVALIVHRHHLPPPKLRIVREETSKHSAEPVADPGAEVVQDKLGSVAGRSPMSRKLFRQHQRCELESSRRAERQFDEPESLRFFSLLSEDEEIGESSLCARGNYLFERNCATFSIFAIW